jgi:hypothetical protein
MAAKKKKISITKNKKERIAGNRAFDSLYHRPTMKVLTISDSPLIG